MLDSSSNIHSFTILLRAIHTAVLVQTFTALIEAANTKPFTFPILERLSQNVLLLLSLATTYPLPDHGA
jgi:hypothetical protein